MKKKTIKIGTLKTPKSRDLLHLQEITHGTGTGSHKSRKDYNRQRAKLDTKRQSSDSGAFSYLWDSVMARLRNQL